MSLISNNKRLFPNVSYSSSYSFTPFRASAPFLIQIFIRDSLPKSPRVDTLTCFNGHLNRAAIYLAVYELCTFASLDIPRILHGSRRYLDICFSYFHRGGKNAHSLDVESAAIDCNTSWFFPSFQTGPCCPAKGSSLIT